MCIRDSRDLKPANLYLAQRPGGKPAIKVLDFGISKAPAATTDDILTKTSAVMGSCLLYTSRCV